MGDNFHSFLPYGTPLGGGMDPARIDQAGANITQALAGIEERRRMEEALKDPRVLAAIGDLTGFGQQGGGMAPRGSNDMTATYGSIGQGFGMLAPQIGQHPGPMGAPGPGMAPPPHTFRQGGLAPRRAAPVEVQPEAEESEGRMDFTTPAEITVTNPRRPMMSGPVTRPQVQAGLPDLTPEGMRILQGMFPQLTQVRVTRMQGDNALEKTRQQGMDALNRQNLVLIGTMMRVAGDRENSMVAARARIAAASASGNRNELRQYLQMINKWADDADKDVKDAYKASMNASHDPRVDESLRALEEKRDNMSKMRQEINNSVGLNPARPRLPGQATQPQRSTRKSGSIDLGSMSDDELLAEQQRLQGK